MIAKWRAGVGLAAGVLLGLSAVAHSLVGWPELRAQLELSALGPDLLRGVQLSWHFGGMAMLCFAVIVLSTYWSAWKGASPILLYTQVIGVAYLTFGILAILLVDRNPLYLVFILPGALLFLASGLGLKKK